MRGRRGGGANGSRGSECSGLRNYDWLGRERGLGLARSPRNSYRLCCGGGSGSIITAENFSLVGWRDGAMLGTAEMTNG